MMTLSSRLQMIADEIKHGETMADIGTDHGFLPSYLVKQGICPKVILTDISHRSLQKSMNNVGEGSAFDFRLGDGISVLEIGEVDIVTIAGMGGILMSQILGADEGKAKSFKKYILQPRNNQSRLRYWLAANEFVIEKELLVREGKYICEILVASPFDSRKCFSQITVSEMTIAEPEFEVPEAIFAQNTLLALEFVQNKLRNEKRILKSVRFGKVVDMEKVRISEKKITHLEKLLQKYAGTCG